METKNFINEEIGRIKEILSMENYDHSYYSIVVGRIKNPKKLSVYKFDNPDSEALLEEFEWTILPDNKIFQNYILKETSFNPVYQKKYLLQDLKNSLEHFCKQVSDDQYEKHLKRMEDLYSLHKNNYFEDLNVNDKKACILSLIYYTGEYSYDFNRRANAVLRSNNSLIKIDNWEDKELVYPIIYYLNKALHNIPMFWGVVFRCVEMTKEALSLYKIGNVVTWIQYSSTCIGEAPTADMFRKRNVWFIIYSLTGRRISDFSYYKEEEKEVLLPPLSNFIIFKLEYINDKVYVYLRQIELALSEKTVLWVDDNIFDPNWENKLIIEHIQKSASQVKIIPKNSTMSAMSFLKSMISQIIKFKINLRIVSDMTRYNESPTSNAGARFYNEMKKINVEFPFFVFTSSVDNAIQHFTNLEFTKIFLKNKNIRVENITDEVIKFLEYKS